MTQADSSTAKKKIRVVAALIQRPSDSRILITQRSPKATMPLKWEFPGGKVEASESDQIALQRELKEELGVEVKIGNEFMSLFHSYEEFDIDFHVYHCTMVSKNIQKLNIHDFRWVELTELSQFEFPAADQSTIRQLLDV